MDAATSTFDPSATANLYRTLARLSWLLVLVSIAGNSIVIPVLKTALILPQGPYVGAIVTGVCAVAGVFSGGLALLGIGRYGRKGILWPAVTGLCLWLMLFAVAWLVMDRMQQMFAAQAPANLVSAVHRADAKRVENSQPAFSFDLPEGYEPISPATLPTKYQQGFMQRPTDEPPRLLLLSRLGGPLPRRRLQASDVPTTALQVSLTTFHWRGLEIDAFRVVETKDDTRYMTYNVQIPLRQEGVQLGVGGSEQAEPLLRALTEQILASFDGETNW